MLMQSLGHYLEFAPTHYPQLLRYFWRMGCLDSQVVFTLEFWTLVCYALGREVNPWWQPLFFGSSPTSTLNKNFKRRWSEGRRKTNYYYYYLLMICRCVYENVLKITKMEKKHCKWYKIIYDRNLLLYSRYGLLSKMASY